jgi:hypothetical protein
MLPEKRGIMLQIREIDCYAFSRIQARETVSQSDTVLFDNDSKNPLAFIWDEDPNDDERELKFFEIVNA